jgi:hypothetical protein
MPEMNKLLAALILTLLVVGAACGSGSGGGEKSGIVAAFTPDEPNPGPDTVAAAEGASNDDLVTVEITVTDTSGIYAVAFDLTYDANMASFEGWSAGNLLEQGGHTPFYQVAEIQNGHIVAVATREGPVSTVDAVGTVTAIEMTFRVEQEGSSQIAFPANASWLLDGQAQPQPIPGITWRGGSLDGLP